MSSPYRPIHSRHLITVGSLGDQAHTQGIVQTIGASHSLCSLFIARKHHPTYGTDNAWASTSAKYKLHEHNASGLPRNRSREAMRKKGLLHMYRRLPRKGQTSKRIRRRSQSVYCREPPTTRKPRTRSGGREDGEKASTSTTSMIHLNLPL